MPRSFEVVKIDQLSLEEIREELQRGLSSKGNRRTAAKRLKDHLIHIRNKAIFPESSPATSFSSSKRPKSTELKNKRRREKCLKVNINGIMDDIVDFMQSSDNVVEVQNSLQELNKQRQMHESLNHEIIDLIGDEEVDDECQQFF